MQEEPKNPNRLFAYPKDLRIAPPTPPAEMLTLEKHEPTKFVNEAGDEVFEIPAHRFAADQMLAISILAGRNDQKPIVPCATIVARKDGVTWRYFSHRTVVEDMPTMTREEALASKLFLQFVFADNDHYVFKAWNLQLKEIPDSTNIHATFFDLHHIGNFWENNSHLGIHKDILNFSLKFELDAIKKNVDQPLVIEKLREKLRDFSNLIQGEQGIAFITEIVNYIPTNPQVLGGVDKSPEVVAGNIARFRDALLGRARRTEAILA